MCREKERKAGREKEKRELAISGPISRFYAYAIHRYGRNEKRPVVQIGKVFLDLMRGNEDEILAAGPVRGSRDDVLNVR